MALGSVFREARSRGSLIDVLTKTWKREQIRQPLQADDYIRVSSIASLCAREETLRNKLNRPERELLKADLLLTFLHGTALHWGLQNHALPEVGVLYGMWRCLGCGTIHGSVKDNEPVANGAILRPSQCSKCSSNRFEYHEHQFVNHELRVTGHADGFLALSGLPGLGVLEAKSVGGKSAWEIKKSPKYDHVIQAQLYLWLSGLQWTLILYWVKGENGLEALREYVIERDDEAIEAAKDLVLEIRNGITSGILPNRICETNDCPRAKACALANPCFKEP